MEKRNANIIQSIYPKRSPFIALTKFIGLISFRLPLRGEKADKKLYECIIHTNYTQNNTPTRTLDIKERQIK